MTHGYLILQQAIDCTHTTEREYLLGEGIQQTEFDTAISIGINAGNDPMKQQWLANITCSKCRPKGQYRKDCPNLAGTIPGPDQNMPLQSNMASMTVAQMETASYAIPQSSLLTNLRELAKVKQTDEQLKQNVQMTQHKQTVHFPMAYWLNNNNI